MAKSIRSKVKKRNRTEMRKNVGDPHQRKLQARCTAKIQKSVAFSSGESISKLKGMLTAAQEANPPTKPQSRSGFSFRHPDAPPPYESDDEPPVPSPRSSRPRGRARSLSDAEASMVSDDIAMGDADEPSTAGTKGAEPGIGKGKGDGEGTTEERRRANENILKSKKQKRQAKRRGWVEFPAAEN